VVTNLTYPLTTPALIVAMGPSAVLVCAILCLSGAEAANILRGKAVTKDVSPNDILKKESIVASGRISGLLDAVKKMEADPKVQKAPAQSGIGLGERIVIQLLFGILYYYLIVEKYPKLDGLKPTEAAIKLQDLDEVSATLHTSLPNCLLSWCCTGPRAAHTFHSTGVLDYWPSCILMSLVPCCTLWAVNSFTDLNEKLGGVKKNLFVGALCACCCSCCVVAQDAQSLDLITGMETGLYGVQMKAGEEK